MKVLSTVLLFLFSSLSTAEDLIDFEISIKQMSSHYRAFIFFDGDDKYKKSLLSIASQASRFDEVLGDKPQLSSRWKAFIDQVYRNFAEGSAVHDVNLQANWTLKSDELNNALSEEKKRKLSNELLEDPLSDDYVRLVLLKMESILTSYMVLTNPVGSYGISAESIDIDIQVVEVTGMLERLNLQDESLKRVARKWSFIKKVLLKYNTKVAPFVVLHSYDKMRKDISQHLASL
jgi:hypothetical protein